MTFPESLTKACFVLVLTLLNKLAAQGVVGLLSDPYEPPARGEVVEERELKGKRADFA